MNCNKKNRPERVGECSVHGDIPCPENMEWVLLFRAVGGHSYFKEKVSGKVAVADGSGPTPDTTEGGVLWLDRSLHIVARNGFWVPVASLSGRSSTTPADADEVRMLCQTFGMQVSIDGALFSIQG